MCDFVALTRCCKLVSFLYFISNLIQKLCDIFGFFIVGVSVVGVASRLIIAVVAPAARAGKR